LIVAARRDAGLGIARRRQTGAVAYRAIHGTTETEN